MPLVQMARGAMHVPEPSRLYGPGKIAEGEVHKMFRAGSGLEVGGS